MKFFQSAAARICTAALLIFSLGAGASAAGEVSTPNSQAMRQVSSSRSTASAAYGFRQIPLSIEGEYIGDGYLIKSLTYVPVLSFCETMLSTTFSSTWDENKEVAFMTSAYMDIEANLMYDYLAANGRYMYIPSGIYNINGTIVAPVRELIKLFSCTLRWNTEDWSIDINTDNYRIVDPGSSFYDEDSVYWLSRVIYSEAGNTEPFEGLIGVGNVILNRVRDPSFPNNIKDVIFQSGQFQVVDVGTIYGTPSEKAIVAAKICLEGYNVVGNSLYFLNPSIASNYWFRTSRTYVMTIQGHEFYA